MSDHVEWYIHLYILIYSLPSNVPLVLPSYYLSLSVVCKILSFPFPVIQNGNFVLFSLGSSPWHSPATKLTAWLINHPTIAHTHAHTHARTLYLLSLTPHPHEGDRTSLLADSSVGSKGCNCQWTEMDLDGQGAVLLTDGHKQRGTKEWAKTLQIWCFADTQAVHPSGSQMESMFCSRLFVSFCIRNLTWELWNSCRWVEIVLWKRGDLIKMSVIAGTFVWFGVSLV